MASNGKNGSQVGNYIRDDAANQHALQCLVDAFQARPLIALIGSGSSVRAGYPTWPGLLDEFSVEARKLGAASRLELDALAKSKDMMWRAHEYRRRIGEEAYANFIRRIFGPERMIPTDFHSVLVSLPFKHFLTTNYDRVLEAAHVTVHHKVADCIPSTTHPEFAQFIANANRPDYPTRYVHIHGMFNDPSSIVLTNEDYNRGYDNGAKGSFDRLFALLATNPVVSIGFSLTDLHVMDVFRRIKHSGISHPHFAILPFDGNQTEAGIERDRLKQLYGVEAIFYRPNKNHDGLHQIIQYLHDHLPPSVTSRTPDSFGPSSEAAGPPRLTAKNGNQASRTSLEKRLRKSSMRNIRFEVLTPRDQITFTEPDNASTNISIPENNSSPAGDALEASALDSFYVVSDVDDFDSDIVSSTTLDIVVIGGSTLAAVPDAEDSSLAEYLIDDWEFLIADGYLAVNSEPAHNADARIAEPGDTGMQYDEAVGEDFVLFVTGRSLNVSNVDRSGSLEIHFHDGNVFQGGANFGEVASGFAVPLYELEPLYFDAEIDSLNLTINNKFESRYAIGVDLFADRLANQLVAGLGIECDRLSTVGDYETDGAFDLTIVIESGGTLDPTNLSVIAVMITGNGGGGDEFFGVTGTLMPDTADVPTNLAIAPDWLFIRSVSEPTTCRDQLDVKNLTYRDDLSSTDPALYGLFTTNVESGLDVGKKEDDGNMPAVAITNQFSCYEVVMADMSICVKKDSVMPTMTSALPDLVAAIDDFTISPHSIERIQIDARSSVSFSHPSVYGTFRNATQVLIKLALDAANLISTPVLAVIYFITVVKDLLVRMTTAFTVVAYASQMDVGLDDYVWDDLVTGDRRYGVPPVSEHYKHTLGGLSIAQRFQSNIVRIDPIDSRSFEYDSVGSVELHHSLGITLETAWPTDPHRLSEGVRLKLVETNGIDGTTSQFLLPPDAIAAGDFVLNTTGIESVLMQTETRHVSGQVQETAGNGDEMEILHTANCVNDTTFLIKIAALQPHSPVMGLSLTGLDRIDSSFITLSVDNFDANFEMETHPSHASIGVTIPNCIRMLPEHVIGTGSVHRTSSLPVGQGLGLLMDSRPIDADLNRTENFPFVLSAAGNEVQIQ
jgi:hypothetical protein